MALSIWELFLAKLGVTDEAPEDSEEADDDGGFVPSPLDVSVRWGHGGSASEQVRELSKIQEQANELEDEQRDG